MISYQGKVTDPGGAPIADGDYSMTFTIYDAATSGTSLWSSGSMTVTVSGGIFSVLLGESPQPTLNLDFAIDCWLEVDIAGDVQSPRQRVGSVGYAYMASGLVPGTEVSGIVADNAVILGLNWATSGASIGVYGGTVSPVGAGIVGISAATTGVSLGVYGQTESTEGHGLRGVATASAGPTYGGWFESASPGGNGVYGYASATTGVTYGVHGESASTDGRGVYGSASTFWGTTYGVFGKSASTDGRGVYGQATATTGYSYGVYGYNASSSGRGVYGYASATTGGTYGIYGHTESPDGISVYGKADAGTGTNYGVYGRSYSTDGRGVYGRADATSGFNYGVYGESASTSGRGVYGYGQYGVWGESSGTDGTAVYAYATATTGTNYGVYGYTLSQSSGYGGYFNGDVHVIGYITKSFCSFLIDHPLDPENKLLRHNCMESPEHLVVYRGKVRLDADGQGSVQMPEYFQALAKEHEASIHLTPAGASPFMVSGQWNTDFAGFTIHGDPAREVFWEVLAERDDPVTRQLARPVEEDKGPDNKYCDRGKLLHPSAYGYPETMGRDYEKREENRRRDEEAGAARMSPPDRMARAIPPITE
jgi:hypothetical protein